VLAATLGGVFGPILVFLAALAFFDELDMLKGGRSFAEYAIGWGIPTATDISVAWVSALCVFGAGHPAINFLLLLAIVDDAIGLLIIAFAYPDPSNPFTPAWLLLIVLAMAIAFTLRRLRCVRWEVYIVFAGPIAWAGLLFAALHPSLALVFIVPFMPISVRDDTLNLSWLFNDDGNEETKEDNHSPLHDFEHSTKRFVDFVVLFAFGAVNAGVKVDAVGSLTWSVLLALGVGKPLGIFATSRIATAFACPPPTGMTSMSVIGVGVIASAGLTVSLFIAGTAYPTDAELASEAKMGALFSVFLALMAVVVSSLHRRVLARTKDEDKTATSADLELPPRQLSGDDEALGDFLVDSTVRNLKVIHQAEKAVETKACISRARTLDELEKIDPAYSRTSRHPNRKNRQRSATGEQALSRSELSENAAEGGSCSVFV
jgi:NhaA family Na+:H+ antiporter